MNNFEANFRNFNSNALNAVNANFTNTVNTWGAYNPYQSIFNNNGVLNNGQAYNVPDTITTNVPQTQTQQSAQAEDLSAQLQQAKDEQGLIGKAWDGFKNLFGVGLSSKDAEEAVAKYQAGQMSYEEAQNTINQFKSKQKGMTDIVANVATGLVVAGTAVATGGLSLGVVATGAAIGGAAKAGIKTLDRATNNVEGDALNAKQMVKDGLTGAIDGAATVLTAGMSKGVTAAGQSVKEAVKHGVVQGAKSGVTAGAITGAGNYTVDAALEEDVDFTFDGLVHSTVENAIAGGVMGGIAGGVTGGMSQAKLNKTPNPDVPALPEHTSASNADDLADNVDDVVNPKPSDTSAPANTKELAVIDEHTELSTDVVSNKTQNAAQNTTELSTDVLEDTGKASQKATENAAKEAAEEASEKAAKEAAKETTENAAEEAAKKAAKEAEEKAAKEAAEKAAKEAEAQAAEEAAKKAAAEATAKANAEAGITPEKLKGFETIEKNLKTRRPGNWTPGEVADDYMKALESAIKMENNPSFTKAFEAFKANPTASTYKTLTRTLSKAYHPDIHLGISDTPLKFYNNCLQGISKLVQTTAAAA